MNSMKFIKNLHTRMYKHIHMYTIYKYIHKRAHTSKNTILNVNQHFILYIHVHMKDAFSIMQKCTTTNSVIFTSEVQMT